MVYKFLTRHPGHLTDRLKHGCRIPVRDIFLVRINFNHGTTVYHRVIRGIMFLHVIRVKRMRHVRRNHEGIMNCTIQIFRLSSQPENNTLNNRSQNRRTGTLFRSTSHFFIIKNSKDFCLTTFLGSHEGF